MSRFIYFDDFKKSIEPILAKINSSKVYILSLRRIAYTDLDGQKKSYLDKNFSLAETESSNASEVIEFYAAVSFCYTKQHGKTKYEQLDATKNFKLFGVRIFPIIPRNEFEKIRQEQSEDWDWHYDTNRTFLIISKKRKISEKYFDQLLALHSDYVENSLNTRNISFKRSNSFVGQYEKYYSSDIEAAGGFHPSVEATLKNIAAFIVRQYASASSSEISMVSVLKFSTVKKVIDKLNKKKEKQNSYLFDFPVSDYYEEGVSKVVEERKPDFKVERRYYRLLTFEICKRYFHTRTSAEHKLIVTPSKMEEWAVPSSSKICNDYILTIPIAKYNDRERFRYALVLRSSAPFKTYLLDSINALLKEYFFTYLETEKSKLLLGMQSRFIYLNDDEDLEEVSKRNQWFYRHPIEDSDDLESKLISITKFVLDQMVLITNAYSATLRLYRPATKTLQKVVNSYNTEARDAEDESELSEIEIDKNARSSLNCRAFLLQKGEEFASYIRDVRKTVPGFSSIANRKQTISELCMPFYYQGVAIGTMNFESPILRAFDDECESDVNGIVEDLSNNDTGGYKDRCIKLKKNGFFYMVKSTLQHFYAMFCEKNDTLFLSRLIQSETNLHELKNLVNSKNDLNLHRNNIKNLLSNVRSAIHPVNECLNIKKLFQKVRDERINACYESVGDCVTITKEVFTAPDYLLTHLPIKIEEKKESPLMIDAGIAEHSLAVIYRNLLTNYFNHGNREKDKLELKYFKKSDTLVITQLFSEPFKQEKKCWFIAPHQYEDVTNSGLFIVGVIVRQLGGHVFTSYDKYGRLRQFDIHISFKKTRRSMNENR